MVFDSVMRQSKKRDSKQYHIIWGESQTIEADLNIVSFFKKFVLSSPDSIAVSDSKTGLTYGELDRESDRVTQWLTSYGCGCGDYIPVFTGKSLDFFIAILGILKCGAAYIPIDHENPEQRIRIILDRIKPKVLLTDSVSATLARNLAPSDLPLLSAGSKIVNLNMEFLESLPIDVGSVQISINQNDAAYVIFTSGTTGIPKGVEVSHRSVLSLAANFTAHFSLGKKIKTAQLNSFGFDASVAEIFASLLTGSHMVVFPSLQTMSPESIAELIVKESINFIGLTPTAMGLILAGAKSANLDLSGSLGVILLGGEALHWSLVRQIRDVIGRNTVICNIYGPTETTGFSTFYKIPPEAIDLGGRIVPIGFPAVNELVLIVNEEEKSCKPNVEGEIWIGGDGVAIGYYADARQTSERFPFLKEGKETIRVYRSGDRGYYDESGTIHFTGRMTDQVKIRGFRVELQEIEKILMDHPAIDHAAVVYRKYPDGRAVLGGFYSQKKDGIEVDTYDLKEHLSKFLPEYMIPHFLVKLDMMPMSFSGKIDKNRLELPDISDQDYKEPANDVERDIAETWEAIFNMRPIGRHANFFSIGGDSISTLHMVSSLLKKGYILKPGDIIKNPILHDLAGIIKKDSEPFRSPREYAPFDLLLEEEREIITEKAIDAFPLSQMQKAMLFGVEATEAKPFYHIQVQFLIQNQFDPIAFQRTLEFCVAKFDQLRTIFQYDLTMRPLQIVLETMPPFFNYIDLRHKTDEEFDLFIDRYFNEDLKNPIQIEKGPLFRIGIIHKNDSAFVLALTIHHLIHDGWSLAVFIQNLQTQYALLATNAEAKNEIDSIPFARFVQHESLVISSQAHRNFWGRQIASLMVTPAPESLDRTVRNADRKEFNYIKNVDELLSERIASICLKNNLSANSFFLSAYFYLLHLLRNEKEICCGLVTSGRSPDIEGYDQIFGCCLNIVPVGASFERKDITVGEFVNSISENVAEILSYSAFPIEEILKLKGDSISANHLFGTIFNYENYIRVINDRIPEPIFNGSVELTAYDLGWSVFQDRNLMIRVSWVPDKYDVQTIERWCDYYINILESMVTGYDDNLFEIEYLNSQEKEMQDSDWNAPVGCSLIPESIHGLLAKRFSANPDQIAVTYRAESLLFGQLNSWSGLIADMLIEIGISPGERIAVILDKSTGMIAAIIGILRVGASYVPMDYGAPEERLVYMLKDSGASLILTNIEDGSWDNLKKPLIRLPKFKFPYLRKFEDHRNDPDDEAYVIYTSGTTGTPKGVIVTHSNVVNLASAFGAVTDMNEDDQVAQFAPLTFDASAGEIFITLLIGKTLHVLPSDIINNFKDIEKYLEQKEVTLLALSPHYLRNLDPSRIGSVKKIMSAGSVLPVDLAKKWSGYVRLVNGYGPTETTIISTACHVIRESLIDDFVPIGRPVLNTKTSVVGVTGKILPIGIPGELYISGKGVTSGYINQPELTSQKFLRNHFGSGDRVYRTGDLAVRLSDGNLVFKGRIDNQVKVRGFRMELDEIETNLCSIPEVESGCVTAFKGKQEEFDLCAYYVLKNGSQLTSEEIRFGLLGRIPVYMVPAYYMSLDSLPLTINGKIDRKRLPPVKFDRSQERAPLVSPRNEIETKLVRVFEDVLQNSPFGIDDNFFLCGGDSVKSIQICSRLRGQGLYVQVRDIIEGQTIRIIAQKIIQVESIEFPSAEIVPDEGKFTYENLPEGELELIKQALKNALKGNPI